jgi:nitroreductase
MELNKIIQSRSSVRKFKSKKPDWQLIIECIDAARYAPMAGNNYSLKFILVDDAKIIQKLADCAQQDFIAQAQYVVVVCSDPKRTKNAYGNRGEIYCRQQAGAAIQNFLLKIEESGLSTCWIGHFTESEIKRELKIPEDIDVEALFPVGYEYEKKRTRRAKIDLDGILYFNKYKQKKLKKPKKTIA